MVNDRTFGRRYPQFDPYCTHPDEDRREGDHRDVTGRWVPSDINPNGLYCLRCEQRVNAPSRTERGLVVDRHDDEIHLSYGGRHAVASLTAHNCVEASDNLARWLMNPDNAVDVAGCIASALFDTADEVEKALRPLTQEELDFVFEVIDGERD